MTEERQGSPVLRAIRLVGELVRPHPLPFGIAVAGSVLYALCAVGGTLVFGRAVDEVVLPAFDGSGAARDASSTSTAAWWAAAIVSVGVLRVAGISVRRYFAGMTSERVALATRRQLAGQYVDQPMSYVRRRPAGELIAHVDSDTERLTEVLHPVPFAIAVVCLVTLSAIALVVVDPLLAIVGFTVFPILVLSNRYYTSRVEAPAAAQQAAVARVTSVAHESIDGALVVKLLGRTDAENERFAEAATELRRHRTAVGDLRAFFEAGLDALPNLGIGLVLLVGAWRVDAGAMTVGELVQVSALFTVLAFPMRVLGFFLESAPPSYVAKGRLAAAMEDERPREADHAATGASVVRLPERPAALEIRGLGIAHRTEHGDRVEVLRDVDLTVADGEVVALVGSTGSGKSSVVAAIAGLVEHEGEVSYGGVPVEQLDPVRRADAIRIGLQEPFLFAASVADNVTLDRVDVSDDEIAQALATAHAADFVAELEHGTDTVVGARGLTLSGGQRQRVALARTLAGAPRVVVLDDATSAIDPVIERRILDGLRAGDAPPSMLIVAQRVSTIRLADRVVFLRGGAVAGVGTHDELLADPAYHSLVTAYEAAAAGSVAADASGAGS